MKSERKSQYIYERGWFRYNLVVLYETCMFFTFMLPRFSFIDALKSMMLRCLGAKVGRRVIYYPGLWIMPCRNLIIGDDVDLAHGVLITTGGGVSIGDRTMIGYRAQILSTSHIIPPKPTKMFDAGDRYGAVKIENDVWIGANAVILPGVTIGEGAVVAAGSAVTKDVLPFTVVGGIPAKIIRNRDTFGNESTST